MKKQLLSFFSLKILYVFLSFVQLTPRLESPDDPSRKLSLPSWSNTRPQRKDSIGSVASIRTLKRPLTSLTPPAFYSRGMGIRIWLEIGVPLWDRVNVSSICASRHEESLALFSEKLGRLGRPPKSSEDAYLRTFLKLGLLYPCHSCTFGQM